MSYKIVQTDKANDQLNDIIQYIAKDSGDDVALNYLDAIEKSILKLKDFPKSGNIPRYSLLKRQGYRVLVSQRHLIFYKIDEDKKLVTIYAIVDSRREYLSLI